MAKTKIGRPKTGRKAFTIRLDKSAIEAIDRWRKSTFSRPFPTRPEIIRQLIRRHLELR